VILNGDDETARRATQSLNGRRQTFGLSAWCDWTARNVTIERGCHAFDVVHGGEALARVRLRLPGRHNMLNALAGFALAHKAGAKAGQIAEALSNFVGCRRRMTLIGQGQGITVLDDYAHHPTEIRTTLQAVRAHYEPRRLWAIFQPHQHSRTRFLLEDFARSFSSADHILVPDIYFVRDSEAERTRIGAPDLVARIRANGGDALHLARFEEIAAHLHANLRDGDLVMTMGAGDVWKVADELAGALALDRE
jgi:UDP-N-acetylmuramate--alanine ligase